MEQFHGTTIMSARREGKVALGGDGQITLGQVVVKASAIWPSPPKATFPSRRADIMVVPWNCSISGFSEDGAGVSSIKLFARNNAGDLAQARDPEQGTDELVRPANLNRGAGLPELREHVQ